MRVNRQGLIYSSCQWFDLSPRMRPRHLSLSSRTGWFWREDRGVSPEPSRVRDKTEEVFVKSYLWVLGLTASVVLLSAGSACGQCRAGRGQAASTGTAAVSASGSSAVGSGQLLTSPGSLYYDVMMQQQMQQALARQQQAIAMQRAQKAQANFEKRLANAEKHRAQAAYKREVERAARSNSLASQ